MVTTRWGMVMRVVAQRVSVWDHFSVLLIRISGSQWSGSIAWATLTSKAPANMLSIMGESMERGRYTFTIIPFALTRRKLSVKR